MKATKKTMKPKMAKGGKMIQTAGNALTKALLGAGYNEKPAKMQKGGEMGEKMNKYMNLSVNLTVTKDKTEPKETESESKMKKGGKMVKKAALGAMMGPKYPGEKRAKRKAEKAQLKSSAEQIASTLSKKGMSVSDFKKSAKAAGATGKSIRMIKRAMKKDANKFGDYKIEYSGKTVMPEKKMAKGGKMSKFDKLASSVAKSYEKKGKSATAAKKIGAAVAAKVGMAKFGKKKMTAMAVKGKKKK